MTENVTKDGAEDMVIRLKFEPRGRPSGERDYYRSKKKNICVVCGADKSFIRKNIVPREYRKYVNHYLILHLHLCIFKIFFLLFMQNLQKIIFQMIYVFSDVLYSSLCLQMCYIHYICRCVMLITYADVLYSLHLQICYIHYICRYVIFTTSADTSYSACFPLDTFQKSSSPTLLTKEHFAQLCNAPYKSGGVTIDSDLKKVKSAARYVGGGLCTIEADLIDLFCELIISRKIQ